MDRYSVSIAQRTPSQSSGPTYTELGAVPASGLSWWEELSREGGATASCSPETLEPDILDAVSEALDDDSDTPGLELWVHRNDTRVHRGPIVGMQVQGETWSFRSAGPLYYCRYMHVLAEIVHSGDDDFVIAAGLIDQWQTEDWGDFGLDTSSVGTRGQTSDRTYDVGDDVFQRLIQFVEAEGFDVWVDDLEVNFGQKGTDKTGTVVLDRRGISDAGLAVSFAAGDLASEALALNTDEPPLEGTSENTTLRDSFGKTGVVGTFDKVTNQSTLNDHAAELQGGRAKPMFVPQPKLLPVEGAGVLDFTTGDTVQYVPRIGIDLSISRRVQMKSVTVGEDGSEEIGVAFA